MISTIHLCLLIKFRELFTRNVQNCPVKVSFSNRTMRVHIQPLKLTIIDQLIFTSLREHLGVQKVHSDE